jgi:tRNA modification GTPase
METVLACLTPPGKAAIATLGVRGPRAWDITRQFFQPSKGNLPEAPTARKYWFGRFGVEFRDEVILAVQENLPTPVLELHCHGGIAVVRMIQELYEQQGVTVVSWQQFLGAGEGAAILALLAHAPTTRTAAILLDQAHGAWQTMTEVDGASKSSRLQRLHDLIPLGQHLVEPWQVVIAGAPNVGKSSLMNALAGYTRSIVSPTPGTTRDAVATRLAIDGWPVEMTDTAGLRQSPDALEQQGIDRARAVLQAADLRLWLLDGSTEPITPEDTAGWCFVINKIDLPAAWDWHNIPGALHISAHARAGLPELCDLISRRLVPLPPLAGEAVPCLPEQIEWVRSAVGQACQPDSQAGKPDLLE